MWHKSLENGDFYMKPPREHHPYGVYRSKKIHSLIIGSFPIGKFTNRKRKNEIKPHELDFFYGGEGNHLWRLLAKSFKRELDSEEKIITFLDEQGISLADVISSCRRKLGSANDAALYDIKWNTELASFIEQNHFEIIYYTSKNVHKWFHQHIGKIEGVREIILLSPSANGIRSIPKMKDYKEWEKTYHGEKKTSVFRELFYRKYFKAKNRTKKL